MGRRFGCRARGSTAKGDGRREGTSLHRPMLLHVRVTCYACRVAHALCLCPSHAASVRFATRTPPSPPLSAAPTHRGQSKPSPPLLLWLHIALHRIALFATSASAASRPFVGQAGWPSSFSSFPWCWAAGEASAPRQQAQRVPAPQRGCSRVCPSGRTRWAWHAARASRHRRTYSGSKQSRENTRCRRLSSTSMRNSMPSSSPLPRPHAPCHHPLRVVPGVRCTSPRALTSSAASTTTTPPRRM